MGLRKVKPMEEKTAMQKIYQEEEDERDEYKSIGAINSWFMGFTSIGGLGQIHSTGSKLSKGFWFVLFLIGVGLTIWNVDHILSVYFQKLVS